MSAIKTSTCGKHSCFVNTAENEKAWAHTTQNGGPPQCHEILTQLAKHLAATHTRSATPLGGLLSTLFTSEVSDSLQKQSHVPPPSTPTDPSYHLSPPLARTNAVTSTRLGVGLEVTGGDHTTLGGRTGDRYLLTRVRT